MAGADPVVAALGTDPVDPADPADSADPGDSADPSDSRVWALTFEHSPVGMALVRTDGSWARVNQSLCRMLGRSAEQLMGLTFQDLTHPDDLAPDLELVQQCLAGERDDYRLDKRYLHADGRTVWGDLSVALVRDEGGAPLHFVSQIVDMSEQRADRERLDSALHALAAANADLEQYAAVVSHDLKTPLNGVRAWLELLVDELAPGQSDDGLTHARVLAARAEAATEHMSALVDAFLAHTTSDPRVGVAGDSQDGRTATRILDLVTSALSDVQVMTDRPGVSVVVGGRVGEVPDVLVSAALVRTLLVNLVSNAVKYRDPSRRLQIDVDAEPDPTSDGRLLVTVRNDGPSIPVDDRERVFSLFSRGSGVAAGRPAEDVGGFGIGLAACHRIVTWHGGRIWIDEPEGGGVAVRFSLPLA